MIVVLAELDERYDPMPELEFDSEFGVGISWRGDNFGEGAFNKDTFKI